MPEVDRSTTTTSPLSDRVDGTEWAAVGTFQSADDVRTPTFGLSGTAFRVTYSGPAAHLVVERVDRSASAELGVCTDTCTFVVPGPVAPADYDVFIAATAELGGSWTITVEERR